MLFRSLCAFTVLPCKDDDPCTLDSCDPKTGCVHTSGVLCAVCTDAASCDDGSACTVDECLDLCKLPGSGCKPNEVKKYCSYSFVSCDDLDPATTDNCDTAKGCTHTPFVIDKECSVALDCVDANECTVSEYCDGVTFKCRTYDRNCDDGDPCTVDTCSAKIGCEHTRIPDCGKPCSDNAQCNDDNPCTSDSCDEYEGKKHCNNKAVSCDDMDSCTVDYCDKSVACVHLAQAFCPCVTDVDCKSANLCNDAACNKFEGFCYEFPRSCDDSVPCTIDSCDPKTGFCLHKEDPDFPGKCLPCLQTEDCEEIPCFTLECHHQLFICTYEPIP